LVRHSLEVILGGSEDLHELVRRLLDMSGIAAPCATTQLCVCSLNGCVPKGQRPEFVITEHHAQTPAHHLDAPANRPTFSPIHAHDMQPTSA
jgi:hypothetical protein